jgi:hypothetical protein
MRDNLHYPTNKTLCPHLTHRVWVESNRKMKIQLKLKNKLLFKLIGIDFIFIFC